MSIKGGSNLLHTMPFLVLFKSSLLLNYTKLYLIRIVVTCLSEPWLATEIFKSKTGVSPELMNDIFHFVERPYNLRGHYTLERKRDHTVYHSSESLFSLAPKLWDLLPNSIKNSASLKEFKTKINTRAFERCPCRICKKYVGTVGFI